VCGRQPQSRACKYRSKWSDNYIYILFIFALNVLTITIFLFSSLPAFFPFLTSLHAVSYIILIYPYFFLSLSSLLNANMFLLRLINQKLGGTLFQGCTHPGCQVAQATKFYTVAPYKVGPPYGTCFMVPFRGLEFLSGSSIFGKFLYPCSNHPTT
jgi:hypothetical protein